ncbi:MAG TPA: hypothetical protein VEI80_02625 [Candidatus Acidoferrales bacterium]|nr:hypothetical protein [Candidatus Acidoferrales bacterium]
MDNPSPEIFLAIYQYEKAKAYTMLNGELCGTLVYAVFCAAVPDFVEGWRRGRCRRGRS